jgi:DNA helicase-2/ATP-dependent DNA helicase PcrA
VKEYVLGAADPGRPRAIDYARELNEQQLAVVGAGNGPLLVIAGAGSGKTRTLTYRVARLLETGVRPSEILLLTFTNKAAREMIRRVEALLPGEDRRITGGTFHHVGNIVLRRNAERVGLKRGFTILDREDAKDLMDDLSGAARKDEEYLRLPKSDLLLEVLSYSRNTGVALEKTLARKWPQLEEVRDFVLMSCRRYEARKRDLNLVDFDDLLVLWHELLQKHPEVREAQRRAWRYILVDEYQDTNRLQSGIVEAIAGPEGNLMVVGDDAQSIYSFRGADYSNIIGFPERHPGCKVFKLEVNYRSVPEILTFANGSIAKNPRQFRKTLRSVRKEGGLPEAVSVADADEQARFVAQQILRLRDEGLPLDEICVLYRAHYHSMELQMELSRLGIPFEVRSGLRFFEQAHVKDAAAYLKIALNGRDELSWKRVLKLVPRVGKATAAKIWSLVEQDRFGDVKEALPRAARQGWEDLVVLIGRLRERQEAPAEMIRLVLEGGYEDYLATAFPNYHARVDDLRRFAEFALRFKDVEQLLSELALTSGVAGQDAMEEKPDEEQLVLSSIHQAKGLEWRAVFVLWLVEGKFPDGRALREEGGEEEERRLFYVACTRAKDRLYLVFPALADERSLRGVIQKPSRFLHELDRKTYEEASVTLDPSL